MFSFGPCLIPTCDPFARVCFGHSLFLLNIPAVLLLSCAFFRKAEKRANAGPELRDCTTTNKEDIPVSSSDDLGFRV